MANRYWVGGAGTWDNLSVLNWSATSGGAAGATVPTNVDAAIFDANSGSGTVTVASSAVSLNTTVNNSGITLSLSGSPTLCTAAGLLTLTAGAIVLNSNTLTCGRFSSSNSNTRTIDFGTGNFTLTGNALSIWLTATATNLTIAGTPVVNCTYSGSTGTRGIVHGASADGSEANAISFNITAGSDIVAFDVAGTPSTSAIKNLNFTGFTGTAPQTYGTTVYGNVTLGTGMTFGTGGISLRGTSGLQTYTSNGVVGVKSFSIDCPGSTVRFTDALTTDAAATVTFINGTVELKNGVTSSVGAFATSGTNQKYLQSTTAGSQATLSQASGTVNASYLTIQDINATGGATWNAYVDQSNIDAGNVDGWNFGISPVVGGAEYTYQLRSFTQPRRF